MVIDPSPNISTYIEFLFLSDTFSLFYHNKVPSLSFLHLFVWCYIYVNWSRNTQCCDLKLLKSFDRTPVQKRSIDSANKSFFPRRILRKMRNYHQNYIRMYHSVSKYFELSVNCPKIRKHENYTIPALFQHYSTSLF